MVKALATRINNEAGPLDLSKDETQEKPRDQVKKKKKEKTVEPLRPGKKISPGLQENTGNGGITAASLGCAQFKQDYGLKYAYLTGGMYKGIASKEMVVM